MTDRPDRPSPRPRAEQDGALRDPEPGGAGADPAQSRPTRVARNRARRRRDRRRQRALIVVVAAIAAAAAALVLLVVQDTRPASRHVPAARAGTGPTTGSAAATASGGGAQLLQPDIATGFLAGAVSDITAVTAFDYRRLDDALSAGLPVTTGGYRRAFQAALTGDAARQLRAEHASLDFELLATGIGAMSADGTQAQVLIFGTETVTSDALPGGTSTNQVTLLATVIRRGARYLISALQTGGNAGLPPGTPDLAAAAEAGREEVLALSGFRRATFAADYQHALEGAVDPLRGRLTAARATTLQDLTAGRYDLSGSVTSVAIESADGDTVVMLIAATTTRTADSGPSDAVGGQYEVTVVHAGTGWLTSRVTPVQAG